MQMMLSLMKDCIMLRNSIKNRRFRLLDDAVYFFVPASKVTEKQVYGKSQKHGDSKPDYSNKVYHSVSSTII